MVFEIWTEYLQYFCHLTISLDCFLLETSSPNMEVQGDEAYLPHSLNCASDILVEVASGILSFLKWAIIRLVCGCITFTSTPDPCEFGSQMDSWHPATCQQFNGRILPLSLSSSLSRKIRWEFHVSKNNKAQGWFFKLKFWL